MDRKKRLRQQRRPPTQRTKPLLSRNASIEYLEQLRQLFASPQLRLWKLDDRGNPTGKPIITAARNVIIDGKPMFEMTTKGTE